MSAFSRTLSGILSSAAYKRIEALMFVCYMADLVAAIVQRRLREAMKEHGVKRYKPSQSSVPLKLPPGNKSSAFLPTRQNMKSRKAVSTLLPSGTNLPFISKKCCGSSAYPSPNTAAENLQTYDTMFVDFNVRNVGSKYALS